MIDDAIHSDEARSAELDIKKKVVPSKKVSTESQEDKETLESYLFGIIIIISLIGYYFNKDVINNNVMKTVRTVETYLIGNTRKSTSRTDNSQCANYTVAKAKNLNIREKPSKFSKKVGSLKKDDKVCVYGFESEWAETSSGWVNGNYLKHQ